MRAGYPALKEKHRHKNIGVLSLRQAFIILAQNTTRWFYEDKDKKKKSGTYYIPSVSMKQLRDMSTK
jgi:hypothetical protein